MTMNMTSDTATDKPASTTYPVFKGLGRKPTFFGVPTTLLFGAFMLVAVITMLAGLAWWGLLLVILPTIAIVTRHDDKLLAAIEKLTGQSIEWAGPGLDSLPAAEPRSGTASPLRTVTATICALSAT